MFAKICHRCHIMFSVLVTGILITVVFTIQASASQARFQDLGNESSCFTCHEDLYYLHDTGKIYCLTVHEDHCTDCHGGDSSVMNKAQSHLGLIPYPQKDDGAKCQECHTQDAQERLATFASMGGYKEIVETVPYMSIHVVAEGFPDLHEPNPIIERLPWVVGAFVIFGLWLVLVLGTQKP